jgi:hypothetical protein
MQVHEHPCNMRISHQISIILGLVVNLKTWKVAYLLKQTIAFTVFAMTTSLMTSASADSVSLPRLIA